MSQAADVIVIGAGISGLKAAGDLTRSGASVIVVEARDRIGGRIHTHSNFASFPVELGAELIHTDEAATWRLVRERGLQAFRLGQIGEVINGQWVPPADDKNAINMDRLLERVADSPYPDETDTAGDYLHRIGVMPEDYPLSLRTVEFDSISMSMWDARTIKMLAEAYGASDYGRSDYHVLGGQKRLIEELAEGLDIRLSQPVSGIDWSASPVQVMTISGHVFAASHVIVTLPPLVLQKRRLLFTPDLPNEKWQAINAFGRCDIVKMIMHFDHRVFPQGYSTLLDRKGVPPLWWSSGTAAPERTDEVLVGWAADANARHLIALSEHEAAAFVLDNLRRVLDQPDLTPTAVLRSHWNSDPFAEGAYPYIMPGGTSAPDIIAQPLKDRVFWAGAAASDHFTSVHGAFEAGGRAAAEIIALRNSTSASTYA
ncbi:MAG: NAD(P)/FAD-dependent oxidoreductase [Chloroflexota bacterium]|nr:NAD(P)/FAD-dependent oxidoreductase [Chloroflexota bacterium]